MDSILDMLLSFLPEPASFTLLESFPLNLILPFWKGLVIQNFFFPLKNISKLYVFTKYGFIWSTL